MRICLFAIFFSGLIVHAQNERRFTLVYNLAQLPYSCYELDAVMSTPDKKYQFLIAFNKTYGAQNQMHNRNTRAFNDGFMKSEPDRINGNGIGGQLRMALKTDNFPPMFKLYCGLGLNYYSYKIRFYENEYVQDQPPFYHYILLEHKDKFKRISTDAQLIFNLSPKNLFFEFGLGLAYNKAMIPESLEQYRNYHLNILDYGYNGIIPVISIRAGAWLF